MRPTSSFNPIGRASLPNSCPVEVSRHLDVSFSLLLSEMLTWRTDSNEDGDHCYMMFSATFNKSCRELARKHLENDYVRIRVGRAGSSHINIQQNVRTSKTYDL